MYRNCRLRIPLLASMLALAIGLIGAGAALAAEWGIEEKSLSELGLAEEAVTGEGGPFTLELPEIGFAVVCEEVEAEGTIIGLDQDEGTAKFSECEVEELPACEVEPIDFAMDTNLTEPEAGVVYDILAPPGGEPFGMVTIEGALCPLAEFEAEITGDIAGKMSAGMAAEQPLVFSEAISEAAGTELFVGEEEAFLDGTMKFKLSGAKAGKKWGYLRPTLCKAAPQEVGSDLFCPAGQGYNGSVTGSLAAGNEVKFSNGEGVITCNEASLAGEYTQDGRGVLNTVTYKHAKAGAGSCLTTRAGETEVKITMTSLPQETSRFDYQRSATPAPHDGLMWWASEPALLPMKITMKGGALGCFYKVVFSYGLMLNGKGGGASSVALGAIWNRFKAEPGNVLECPAELTQSNATMVLARPGGNVYVTKR